jgi:hypothetical protein
MENNLNYPNQYELHQTLSEYLPKHFIVKFSQRRGIFITNANIKEYADFLSGIFYDNVDLEELRLEALGLHDKSAVAGFWLKSDDSAYDLIHDLDRFSNTIIDENNKMELGAITGNDKIGFKGHVDYLQQQPGRVQFLQGTPRDFDFFVQKKADETWEILVEGEKSNDAKLFFEWIDKVAPREVKVLIIDQSKLSTEQTIEFFDRLATRALPPEWKFTEVKRIVVRQESSCEDDENEIETSMLTGISQAILEGNDLRSNPFVKECEESGYRFTAMTYRYEHSTHPYIIEVRAEFKGRPKVFEVGLENYFQLTGLEGTLQETTLPMNDKTRLLSRFYSEAKHLFDDLVNIPVPLRDVERS